MDKIKELLSHGRLDDALGAANAVITRREGGDSGLWEAYYLRGRIYWRLGERRLAMNDYHRSAALNPRGPAVQALAQANDILSFFNPDIFNP